MSKTLKEDWGLSDAEAEWLGKKIEKRVLAAGDDAVQVDDVLSEVRKAIKPSHIEHALRRLASEIASGLKKPKGKAAA